MVAMDDDQLCWQDRISDTYLTPNEKVTPRFEACRANLEVEGQLLHPKSGTRAGRAKLQGAAW